MIREHFGSRTSGDATRPVPADAARPDRAVIAVAGPDPAQLQVRLAWATPPGIDAAYAARLVLAEMLTRRAATVRERLGASYGMYARHDARLGPGRIVVAGAIDAVRGGESLAALRQGIDSLRRGEDFL